MSLMPFNFQRMTVINMGIDDVNCQDLCIEIGRLENVQCCFGKSTSSIKVGQGNQSEISSKYSIIVEQNINISVGDRVILEQLCGDVWDCVGTFRVIEKNCYSLCGIFDNLQLNVVDV